MLRNQRYHAGACLGLSLTALLVSCDQFLPVTPPNEDLPAELRFVVENKSMFVTDDDHPIKQLMPGTIIDDLSTLDGCWGSAVLADVEVAGEPLAAVFFVTQYRASLGEQSGWFMIDLAGRLRFVSGVTGTFEVLDGNRLAEESFVTLQSDPETRELVMHEPSNPMSGESLATLDGDRLRLRDPDVDREPVDNFDAVLQDVVYRRFECPE